MQRRVGGCGGAIAIDSRGRVDVCFNTDKMSWAVIRGGEADREYNGALSVEYGVNLKDVYKERVPRLATSAVVRDSKSLNKMPQRLSPNPRRQSPNGAAARSMLNLKLNGEQPHEDSLDSPVPPPRSPGEVAESPETSSSPTHAGLPQQRRKSSRCEKK